jgi:hypothetical protein
MIAIRKKQPQKKALIQLMNGFFSSPCSSIQMMCEKLSFGARRGVASE